MSDRPYLMYLRKSSEEDERQAQSLESQETRGRELATKLGVDVVVVPDAHSAKEPGRPVFDRVIAEFDKGLYGGLIAWHPDRLSRNEIDAAAITYRIRKGKIPDLHFASYTFINSNEGIMMLQNALSMSQYSSSKLSVDVTRGMTDKINLGWFPYLAPPGYVNNSHMDKGLRTISTDVTRFPIIRRAFTYFLTGSYSGKELLRIMNDEWGYRSRKRRKSGDTPMSTSTLYHILSNIFYAGYFRTRNKTFKGQHEPMITLDEHYRVLKILGKVPRIDPHGRVFAYTRSIRCASCGFHIVAYQATNRFGSTYGYYRCTRCRGQNIEEGKLQEQVEEYADQIHILPEFAEWAEQEIDRCGAIDRAAIEAILKQKREALQSIEQQLGNLLTGYGKGIVEENDYVTRKKRLQAEQLLLLDDVNNAARIRERATNSRSNVLPFIINVKDWLSHGDFTVRQLAFRHLGSNPTLDARKLILELHPLLQPIRDRYKGLEVKYWEIKLDKTLSESTKNRLIQPVRTAWCAMWSEDRTWLQDHGSPFPDVASKIAHRRRTELSEDFPDHNMQR